MYFIKTFNQDGVVKKVWIGIMMFLNNSCAEKSNVDPSVSIPRLIVQPIELEFIIADSSIIYEEIYAKGICKPHYEEMYTYTSFGIIEDIFVQEGSRVKKGDSLITILDVQLEEKLQSLLLEKENYLLTLEKNLIRLGYTIENVPDNIFENVSKSLNGPLFDLQINYLFKQKEKTQIKAGFDGVIVSVHGIKGKAIQPGIPLVEMISENPILIEFAVPANKIETITPGLPILVGDTIQGIITHQNQKIDDNDRLSFTGTIPLKTKHLLPGKKMDVTILLNAFKGIHIPKNCIIHRSGRNIAFKIEQGKPTVSPVSTRLLTKNLVWIETGISPGDTIILNPPPYLTSRTPIILVP
jgi:hypothetical protein